MNAGSTRKSAYLGAVIFALAAFPIQAADRLIEEIIVTAQKREQTQLEVPLSMQSFSGAALEEQGIHTLDDIIEQIPGGLLLYEGTPGSISVHMRGSGATSIFGDSTIGFYVDETPFSIPNLQVAPPPNLLYDLERVEVLRGPQGTLYGQGSMGGTIKYVSRQPDLERFAFKAQANASDTQGGDGNYRADAVLNIPIVEDKFGLRVLVGYDEVGGFASVPDLDSGDEGRDSTVVRVKALWRATDNLDVTASVLNYSADQQFPTLFVSADPPLLPPSGGFVPDNGTDTEIYSLLLDWDLGFASLISSSSLYDNTSALSVGGTLELPIIAPGLGVGFLPFKQIAEYGNQVFAQEVRLVSATDGPLNWIVGGFYTTGDSELNVELSLDFTQADPANPPFLLAVLAAIESQSLQTIDTDAFALFGELSFELLDGKLVPLVGLRYFEDDRATVERFTGIDFLLGPLVDHPITSDQLFDSVNPRFNLSYYPDDDTTLYANVAKGFRSGTVQLQAQVAALTISGIVGSQLIEPDTVWTYEAGVKKELADGALVLQGALYYSDWQDLQSLYTTLTGVNSVVQLGDVDIFGVEWDFGWQANENLRLGLNGAYTNSEFGELDPVLAAGIPQAEKGNRVPFTPNWTTNVNATYTRPLANTGLDAFGYLSYTYRDGAINYTLQEGEDSHDLTFRLGVQAERWSAYFFAENLLNQDDILLYPTITFFNVPYPRKLGLAVSFNFE